jgi:2-polyprenyl-3-methyl-5-hydroxy-6-metoxy-1,4-benzoquinol methylase
VNASISSHYLGEKGKQYVNERQETYYWKGLQINAERVLPYLTPSDTVLDFGCGPGGLLHLLKKHVARIDGLEINPAAAAMARASGCRVFSGLEEIPKDSAYDAIVTNHVLEHVRDVCGTLETLRASLKPGGRLVVVLPIDDFRTGRSKRWDRNDVDHHLATWTPRLFANVLFESGFDVQECRVITTAWHPRLFPLMAPGLSRIVCWATAVALSRRQLMAVATAP